MSIPTQALHDSGETREEAHDVLRLRARIVPPEDGPTEEARPQGGTLM